MARQSTKRTVSRSRELCREMSLPEILLWRELRGAAAGFKFRRQHPVGTYVLDFYCPAATLAVEVDGIAHDMGDRPERDRLRDQAIESWGIEVVRILAKDVVKSPSDVAEAIVALCRERCA